MSEKPFDRRSAASLAAAAVATPAPRTSLSIAETAARYGCSEDTVRRMIARGDLPAYRYGPRLIRIDIADVEKLRRPVTPTAAYRAERARAGEVA